MPPLFPPLADAKHFSLNSAGVAGFFGGKEAISAMATVHLYKGRRWLGWFNSPGSYVIAKRFGRMANGRFWDGLFPGSDDSPAVTFGLDGKKGPKYTAALSGTTMNTGHLAYLTIEHSKSKKPSIISGRETTPVGVTYMAMKPVNYDDPVGREPVRDALLGLIPISISVVTCVMCAICYDWYSFSMILLGIISSGLASIVIGEGRLIIKSVAKPASGAPPGHGILMGDGEVVVIKGNERDVNAITKGHFELETGTERRGKNGIDPKQADEQKGAKLDPCDGGGCNCRMQVDEENGIGVEQYDNGGCGAPEQGDEETDGNRRLPEANLKHGDQAETAGKVLNAINEEDEKDLVRAAQGGASLGTGLEPSNSKESVDPKQADRAKFAEEAAVIDRIERGMVSTIKCGVELKSPGSNLQRPVTIAKGYSGFGCRSRPGTKKGIGFRLRGQGRANDPQQGPWKRNTIRRYDAIGCSSLLLLFQFLLQLLLIPQGSLFGQIMFLISLGVSWAYNSYLSSLEKEKIQIDLLFKKLGNPEMRRFRAGTRTTMAVFVCLLLFHDVKCRSLEEEKTFRRKAIRSCVGNDTPVWTRWLDKVIQQILNLDGSDALPYLQMDKTDWEFSIRDRKLLKELLKDAAAAIREYLCVRDELPLSSSSSVEEQDVIADTTDSCTCDEHCAYCDCNRI